jgi:hypothetical protein
MSVGKMEAEFVSGRHRTGATPGLPAQPGQVGRSSIGALGDDP